MKSANFSIKKIGKMKFLYIRGIANDEVLLLQQ